MKFAELIIKPTSPFGTPLKGDTLFGHFYWQLLYDTSLLRGNLEALRDTYGHEPFVVFSSAFPRLKEGWLLPRPALPLSYFPRPQGKDCFETLKTLKAFKKKKWIFVKDFQINLKKVPLLNEEEAAERAVSSWGLETGPHRPKRLMKTLAQPHNAINRLTSTTGRGFAPYQLENFWFMPGLRLSVFVLYREGVLGLEEICEAFSRIGLTGFGRDASSGLGRFEVEEVHAHPLPKPAPNLYTLSPYVPQKGEYERLWYQPFVRFGRHGGPLVLTGKPFKNPVLMAEEGAVLNMPAPKGPYVGRALSDLSKAEERTIGQGFSIVFPLEGMA